ncbi:unnamed protein product [Gadus morhua 'NCC']
MCGSDQRRGPEGMSTLSPSKSFSSSPRVLNSLLNSLLPEELNSLLNSLLPEELNSSGRSLLWFPLIGPLFFAGGHV